MYLHGLFVIFFFFFAYIGAWLLGLWKHYLTPAELYWCTSSHQMEEKCMSIIGVGKRKNRYAFILFTLLITI